MGVPRPIPAELTRTALLERLEGGDAQLIALVAPTGYGKTTLLAQYARNAAHTCVWLALSTDDGDPRTLSESLACALEAREVAVPRARAALERSVGGEALARALGVDLNEYGRALDLICDGAERIGALAGRWLTGLAENLGPGQRVLLSGFDVTELRLARLIAKGTAAVIGVDALRFSSAEGVAYLRSRGFQGDAAAACEHCDGWPVGLGLIGAGAHADLTPDDLVLDALEGLTPELRAVLPELAVFEVWEELIGRELYSELPAGWLSDVRRAGLPLTPLGGGEFKPHAILRLALGRLLGRDPLRYARAHRAAGARAQTRGATLQALEHYVLAGDQSAAFALLRERCERCLTASEYELIRQLLEPFAPESLPPDLRAALAAAWIEGGELGRAHALLHALQRTGEVTPLAHYVLGKEAARRGDYTAELQHAEAGLALEPRALNAEHGFERHSAGWRACERLKGWALLDLKRAEEASRYANQIVARCEAQGDAHDLGATLLLAHNAALALGQRALCERHLRRALEIYAALDAPVRVAMIRNELADLLCERGDLSAAQSILEPALEGVTTLPGEVTAHLLETQGDLRTRQGQTSAALEAFEAARTLCDRHRLSVLGERIAGKLEALRAGSVPEGTVRQGTVLGETGSEPRARLDLAITAFGERGVKVNGQAVTVSLSKSFELLVYLALHGPSTREAIMDALWDGSREARHQEYFKVAVRRLRAQLSAAQGISFNPVPLGERYALHPSFAPRVDAHAVEQPDAANALETALEGLNGAFLEGIETAWATERREQYAAALEGAYLYWGTTQRDPDPERAVALFTRGLKHHPTSEALLVALVETLCALGRQAAAAAAFTRFKSVLRHDLGLEPDGVLLARLARAGLGSLPDSLTIPPRSPYSLS